MTELDPELQAYFERTSNEKQERYDRRIAFELLKLWNVPPLHHKALEMQAEGTQAPGACFSPEWLSDELLTPIFFRAYKDYTLSQHADGFPGLADLLYRWPRGGKWKRLWSDLWLETLDRAATRPAAVVFRPKWAEENLVLHNYSPILQPSARKGGTLFTFDTDGQLIALSPLTQLVQIMLNSGWRPHLTM